MRRRARVDDNQPAIVAAFRIHGFTVQHLHTIGGGCPDLLVGRSGINWIVEVKDGAKPPSKRKLTPDERVWHDAWGGKVHVVESVDDVEQMARWLP